MDLGNIVYIIAIIGYFIYQMTRKKAGQEIEEQSGESPAPPQKNVSFEDLMREIRDAQRPAPEPVPQPVRPSAPIVKVKKQIPTYAEPVQDDEIRYYEDTFEKKGSNPYHASKDRHSVVTIPELKINFDSHKSKTVNPYAVLLKNPKTLKEAIVVSEILKPKHF